MVARWQDFLFARWGNSDWWRFAKKMIRYAVMSKPFHVVSMAVMFLGAVLFILWISAALLRGQVSDLAEITSKLRLQEYQISELKDLHRQTLANQNALLEKFSQMDKRLLEMESLMRIIGWAMVFLFIPIGFASGRFLWNLRTQPPPTRKGG